jgi:hypothetical protein
VGPVPSDLLVLELPQGGELRGSVTFADGAPVESGALFVEWRLRELSGEHLAPIVEGQYSATVLGTISRVRLRLMQDRPDHVLENLHLEVAEGAKVHRDLCFRGGSIALFLTFVDEATGDPIQGVHVFNQHGPDAASNEDGCADMRSDASKENVAIRAEHPSYVPLAKRWTVDELVLQPEWRIALSAGHTIAGIVEDPAGLPQSGLEVACRRSGNFGAHLALVRESLTDAEGRFRLATIPDWDRVVLTFSREGRLVALHDVEMAVAKSRERWILHPGMELSGWAEDVSGKPIAGATIAAMSPLRAKVITARSGEDGAFAFDGLFSGRWLIGGHGELAGREVVGVLAVDLPGESIEPLRLRLADRVGRPTIPVRFHLTNARTGRPLTEATRSLLPGFVPGSGSPFKVRQADADTIDKDGKAWTVGGSVAHFELEDGWISESFGEGLHAIAFAHSDFEPCVTSFEVAGTPLEIEIPMVPIYGD